jgi:hypothetical protein
MPPDHYQTPAATAAVSTRVGPILLSLPSYQRGSNVLAVELHQPAAPDLDKNMGVQLDAIVESFTNGPAMILSGPVDLTVREGQPATFQVFSVGGVSFQWQQNSVDIPGATSASYKIANAFGSQDGSLFRVSVTSPVSGTSFSTNARPYVLWISNPPVLLSGYLTPPSTVLIVSKIMAIGPAQTTATPSGTTPAGVVTPVTTVVLDQRNQRAPDLRQRLAGRYVVVVNNLTDAYSRRIPLPPTARSPSGPTTRSSPRLPTPWKYLLINTNEEIQTSYFAPNFDDSGCNAGWRSQPGAAYVEGANLPDAQEHGPADCGRRRAHQHFYSA